jgi:hypothetical protein
MKIKPKMVDGEAVCVWDCPAYKGCRYSKDNWLPRYMMPCFPWYKAKLEAVRGELIVSNRAQMEICKLVGLDYQVDWPELVGRVGFELSKLAATEGGGDGD